MRVDIFMDRNEVSGYIWNMLSTFGSTPFYFWCTVCRYELEYRQDRTDILRHTNRVSFQKAKLNGKMTLLRSNVR